SRSYSLPLHDALPILPPPYWTGFDITTNIVGYAPLGFLLVLAMLRSGWVRSPVVLATLAGGLLSVLLEFLQIYLPRRVPSNLDRSEEHTSELQSRENL